LPQDDKAINGVFGRQLTKCPLCGPALPPSQTRTELTLPVFLETDHNHFGWDAVGGFITFPSQHFGMRGDIRRFHAFQDLEILGSLSATQSSTSGERRGVFKF
jgi:hypothetical protein